MRKYRIFTLIVLLSMLLTMAPAQSVRAEESEPYGGEITRDMIAVPGEVVVTFQTGMKAKTYAAMAASLAESSGAELAAVKNNVVLLRYDPDINSQEMADQALYTSGVIGAQPNYVYATPEKMAALPAAKNVSSTYVYENAQGEDTALGMDVVSKFRSLVKRGYRWYATPTFPNELPAGNAWAWDKTQADLIWNSTIASPTVCLLDTGVDKTHPDLKGRVVAGYDFVNEDKLPDDDNGHGTHVAGIISALLNNGASTAAGVSNGKVLAVKVLNAQGIGTTYSVAAGLYSCADNATVSIINISLGSSTPDKILYDALRYAIYTKSKLVVAAVGNDSSSAYTYPAAWGDADTPLPVGVGTAASDVSNGLISVGAAAAPTLSAKDRYGKEVLLDKVGVDLNSDGVVNTTTNEVFNRSMCASGGKDANDNTYGSNYGKWVNIVAPGESIYSTTPVGPNFYLYYYQGVAQSYAAMTGTSMAAGFVAGAAARVYPIVKAEAITSGTVINKWGTDKVTRLKAYLVKRGTPLTDYFAVQGESGGAELADVSTGYSNPTGKVDMDGIEVSFGVPYRINSDDPTRGRAPDMLLAPFCWPKESSEANFGAAQSMNNNIDDYDGTVTGTATVYLNVAAAMNRAGVLTEVKNATTGQPLDKVNVGAYEVVGTKLVQRALGLSYAGNGRVMLINIPVSDNPFKIQVSKSGYTAGYQTISQVTLNADRRGVLYDDPYSNVSLPPLSSNISFVLNWDNPDVDLDMYLALPTNVTNGNGSGGGYIGPLDPPSGSYDYLGVGTLLSPAKLKLPATTFMPYAQHMFNGGYENGTDVAGYPLRPGEYLAVVYSTALKVQPFSRPKFTQASNVYNLYVTEENSGKNGYLDRSSTNGKYVAAIVRAWVKGNLVNLSGDGTTFEKSIKLSTDGLPSSNPNCNGSLPVWYVLQMDGSSASWHLTATDPANTCLAALP